MFQRPTVITLAVALATTIGVSAQGHVTPHGRAITEFRSDQVLAVINYEYSQRHHDGAWLLVEFAVQAKDRIVIHRTDLSLVTPDEQVIPIASQPDFLADHNEIAQLLQNASTTRRTLEPYFTSRPLFKTIHFVSMPGGIIHDSAISNPDEVATGDLFFKSPAGKWAPGAYRLVLNHDKAKAELPITLE